MAILEFKDVSFSSDGKDILKKLSFTIDEGDYVSIVGPSGSGKSTLLKLASYLQSPTSGAIIFDGKSLEDYNPIELRQAISYCFQTPHLFGDKVKDNIQFPYDIRHLSLDQTRVKELFELFKMDLSYLEQDVKKLSGGEKQRIALIRQLLFEPRLLLLDEVTSALDSVNKEIVENVIARLHNKGITILWITHDSSQSKKYANKRLTIVSGELESMEEIK
ncbi:ABC transporter ATP-binding protein [Streptococcus pseudoporcinus]|uniref:ABC transporter, ATP-binding protein n=1 Tax=Streptococcus pseudoporcinus TaxID=361101 RepID=A0A4U9XUB0_9STRE|nr:ATP-binding cassette domain-containing protein [Streptococcus pseudoporcinus]VTS16766.1 ABC transporter, ATP-binding protein [Streptococcus pseudoporcinus]VUC68059.1 ABC transporter, ATP-binding protein [Streptococcus pseudoporcinus]VUC98965.1 ABC transporter, ATP-binding protein [Streptococcus pseudoporcinus]VUC99357.1 ABC transporter, ATP-binding protein [Streptococcus pseudoporcinus]